MISDKGKSLQESATLALAARAKAMKDKGEDVLSLSVGEPDWMSYPPIQEAGITAIKTGKTTYTAASGIKELKEAVLNQFHKDFGVTYTLSEVSAGTGAKYMLYSLFYVLLNSQEEVLIPSPYWTSYPDMVQIAGGKPVIVNTNSETNFKLTKELLKKSITKNTKILLLNSPNNPTGAVYSKEEWESLGEVLKEHPSVLILCDDTYNRLVFKGKLAPHFLEACPDLKSRTFIVNSASKSYAMTGWRLGWALGDSSVISAVIKFQSQTTSSPSQISQWGALEAINQGESYISKSIKELEERREFFCKELSQISKRDVFLPEGAFFVWWDISQWLEKSYEGEPLKNSINFAEKLLQAEKVITVPGDFFGQEGYLRLSYALSLKDLQRVSLRLKTFISKIS